MQLVRKMSAKLGAMTARKPWSSSAQGACSRDEPQPKLRPATRIGAPAYSGAVEREALLAAPVPEEQELAEARALDALEELLGDDLVGVDVGTVERADHTLDARHRLHQPTSARSVSNVRTSTRWPAMAAAAAIGGLTRWVRPPLPWRPSKLRLLVEAQRSPGCEDVVVHGEAHRAAGVAPLEARGAEDLVEALGLGLRPSPASSPARPSRARRRRRVVRGPRRRRHGGRAAGRWCRSR